MIKYIKLINSVFNKNIISSNKNTVLDILYYNKEKKCFFTLADKKKIASLFKISFIKNVFLKPLKTQLFATKGFFFIQSINGIVVLDYHNKQVYKILELRYEPNFIANEQTASHLLNSVNPLVIRSFTIDTYGVLVQELIVNEKKLSWNSWGKVLKSVFPLIIIPKNSPIKYSNSVYIDDISSKLLSLSNDRQYLVHYYKIIISDLLFLLKKYNTCNIKNLYKIFIHGDLTPNNIMVKDNDFLLIDFANGGIWNSTYDLMLQNFYFTKSLTWRLFNNISFKNNIDSKIFFGQAKLFFNLFEKTHRINISEAEIKLSIIISLAEIFIKSDLRYQSEREWKNGVGMFKNIQRICNSIKKSILSF